MKRQSRWPAWSQSPARRRFASEAARQILSQNSLDNLETIFALADRGIHHHKGRAVSQVQLEQAGGETVTAFVKMNWGRRRLIPRVTDIRTRQVFQSLPVREWEGIGLLESLGLNVPERLALLQRGWFWFQHAIIIKRVPPPFSLDDMFKNGEWDRLAGDAQRALLDAVIDVMQHIHRAGLGWRGTCTRHFFPERLSCGSWQLWLIDCEGVHRHATKRAIQRDYRKLFKAFEISGAKPDVLLEFRKLSDQALRAVADRKFPLPAGEFSLGLSPKLKPTV